MANSISGYNNMWADFDFKTNLMYIPLYLLNLYFLHSAISSIGKLLFWKAVIGIIDDVEYKSSGEYTSAIPTVSYIYKNKIYLAKPVGSYRAEGFLKDAPIKIFVNPSNPEKFSINNWEVVLTPLVVLVIINITSIKSFVNAVF